MFVNPSFVYRELPCDFGDGEQLIVIDGRRFRRGLRGRGDQPDQYSGSQAVKLRKQLNELLLLHRPQNGWVGQQGTKFGVRATIKASFWESSDAHAASPRTATMSPSRTPEPKATERRSVGPRDSVTLPPIVDGSLPGSRRPTALRCRTNLSPPLPTPHTVNS